MSALRLPYHRGTTAHTASLYPFAMAPPATLDAPLIGVDLLAGASPFAWDPFAAYAAKRTTNPNTWILGEPGNGKSALVKSLITRSTQRPGDRRWFAIIDPKGEYRDLAARLGLTVLAPRPGGGTRLNPLADITGQPIDVAAKAELVASLLGAVLARPLTPFEDAAVFEALTAVSRSLRAPTLDDLHRLLRSADARIAAALDTTPTALGEQLATLGYAFDKLLTRSLRGMFDGPSTVTVHPGGRGLLVDLSAVPLTSAALAPVMVAAAGWLRHLLHTPGPPRIQILDEAWAMLATPATAAYLQSCFKLGRAHGVANICIAHRVSDLAAQADDGTATAKIAGGLLADAATKVFLRQAPDELANARTAAGLNDAQAELVSHLIRGRALWRHGDNVALVHHIITPAELAAFDTDHRMTTAA